MSAECTAEFTDDAEESHIVVDGLSSHEWQRSENRFQVRTQRYAFTRPLMRWAGHGRGWYGQRAFETGISVMLFNIIATSGKTRTG